MNGKRSSEQSAVISDQLSVSSDQSAVKRTRRKKEKVTSPSSLQPPMAFREETDREGITRVHASVGDRLYETMQSGDHAMIVGPHEGLVDELGLPAEAATRLHNILYRRKLYNYTQASSHPQEVFGAIQEFYALDVQKLVEAFYRFEQENNEPVRS